MKPTLPYVLPSSKVMTRSPQPAASQQRRFAVVYKHPPTSTPGHECSPRPVFLAPGHERRRTQAGIEPRSRILEHAYVFTEFASFDLMNCRKYTLMAPGFAQACGLLPGGPGLGHNHQMSSNSSAQV